MFDPITSIVTAAGQDGLNRLMNIRNQRMNANEFNKQQAFKKQLNEDNRMRYGAIQDNLSMRVPGLNQDEDDEINGFNEMMGGW